MGVGGGRGAEGDDPSGSRITDPSGAATAAYL